MVKTKTIDLPSCTTLTYLQALEKITATINLIIEEVNKIEESGIGDIAKIEQDIININANKQDKITNGEDVEINNNVVDLTQSTKAKILSIENKVNYDTMVEYVNTQIGNAIEEVY